MLADIFYWVLNMNITATISGIVVLILRRIRRIPRTIINILWILPFIRLIFPFSLGFRYSIMNLLEGTVIKTVPFVSGDTYSNFTMTNGVKGVNSYFPLEYKTDALERIFSVASVVWIIIAASCVLISVLLYIIAKSEVGDAKHMKKNIYVSGKLLSPAVFGIFRPKIILPEYLKDENPEYVIMHENAHIRRMDNLWRIVAVITCCIHWFNPFIWLFLKRYLEDMELSCDEKVLRKCSEDQKIAYAKALIECEAKKTIFASAFGGAKTQVRIEKILSYRKLTVFSAIGLVALVIAVAAALLTNAAV